MKNPNYKIPVVVTIVLLCTISSAHAQQTHSEGVVSHEVKGPPHKWTREEMLLAQPMPMSGEERKFVFSNKSVQKLHEWSLADYKKYSSSPIGRRILFEEGNRWIDLRCILKAQVEFARDFLAGKIKRPKPLPNKHIPKPPTTSNANNQIGGAPGVSPSGAAEGSSGPFDDNTPSMNLRKNLSNEELFLKNQSELTSTNSETMFSKLKSLRTDISKYCSQYDQLLEKAKKSGKGRLLEKAMASVIWE